MFGRQRGWASLAGLYGVLSMAISIAAPRAAAAQMACFERIDTGVDMTGWQLSTTNPHGPGTGWTVEGGAFVGRQTAGQQGGILMTDKAYKDVEVVFEVKIDWGCDSGFFFRTTAGARAYQVTVDHLAESGVGTIYGEGFAQDVRDIPYFLTDSGNAAVAAPNLTPSFDLSQWPTIWHPTEFNEIRARVEGNPPHIQVWISDLKVMDFTDEMLRSEIDAQGPLAIQVHSGSRWIEGGSVSYRNIRVKDLGVPCNEPDPGTGGNGGAAGAAGAGATAGGTAGSATGGSAGQASGGVAGTTTTTAGSAGATAGMPSGTAGTSSTTPPAPAAENGGCGCRMAAVSSSLPWAGLLLALGGILRRARRPTPASPAPASRSPRRSRVRHDLREPRPGSRGKSR
jgi:MYXO-CTERM domain-containing protein